MEVELSKMNRRVEFVFVLDQCRIWFVFQVWQLQEGVVQLWMVYVGEYVEVIVSCEQEVLQGWKELLVVCEDVCLYVSFMVDVLCFYSQVCDLFFWMDGIVGQIGVVDKFRCFLIYFQIFNKGFL